ncbi:MAG: ASKHA domain-containing protein [Lachnospiraceae bacterium]|nr:ASKHA domain-containing protein [Lachnospiraceae bacterium]
MEYEGCLEAGKTLLQLLQEKGIPLSADCGGRGSCGKCRVQFLTEAPKTDEIEERLLTEQERAEGIRLACRCRKEGGFRIRFFCEEGRNPGVLEVDGACRNSEEDRTPGILELDGACRSKEEGAGRDLPRGDVLAVDLGTTTIAAVLFREGRKGSQGTRMNSQRSFGADVISRIQAASEGHEKQLQELVQRDLRILAKELGARLELSEVIISGNTTMQHLLEGLSTEGMGKAPYRPVSLSFRKKGNITFLPGISAFVGADILSGIVASGMDQSEETCLLLDLGTNGEMAVGNKERILVASTAAGPAFEGGNISCGMAAVGGAISRVRIRSNKAELEVIGGGEPRGVCGSGVLETVYELLRSGLLDQTGLLAEPYFDRGFPLAEGLYFTNKDVREVQLAKAAVRAGLETLLREYGTELEGVERLYLAGSFGQGLDLEKAAGIGILPEELLSRAIAVGNSSLSGACLYAADRTLRMQGRFLRAAGLCREVELAESAVFQRLFLECMDLGPAPQNTNDRV